MKKTFMIKANDRKYTITSSSEEFNILKSDLEFKGKDFFDKFLKDLELKEKLTFVVEKDESIKEGSNEERIFNELSKIISNLETSINVAFGFVEDSKLITEEDIVSSDDELPFN